MYGTIIAELLTAEREGMNTRMVTKVAECLMRHPRECQEPQSLVPLMEEMFRAEGVWPVPDRDLPVWVDPCGWLSDDEKRARALARAVAEGAGASPAGQTDAEMIAAAVCLARQRKMKYEIRSYLEEHFGRNRLTREDTFVYALRVFLSCECFQSAIDNGSFYDEDPVRAACLAAALAEPYYTVPRDDEHWCYRNVSKEVSDRLIELNVRSQGCVNKVTCGNAAFLVRGRGLNDPSNEFWRWLGEHGFEPWVSCKGYSTDWVWINMNTKRFGRGMQGIRITGQVGFHAISVEEFKQIVGIFEKYEGLALLDME